MKDSSATILLNTENNSGEYTMFDLRSLDAKGAVLSGPLLMEIGESFQIRVAHKGSEFELRAKVHAVSEEQMTIRFVDLDSKAKAFLAKK
ncbi:MAG: hypothetical protein JKY56_00180 [Kofleriaceae bacterium]|nr:hypothetical protein [Kofleriaceae bacterium]